MDGAGQWIAIFKLLSLCGFMFEDCPHASKRPALICCASVFGKAGSKFVYQFLVKIPVATAYPRFGRGLKVLILLIGQLLREDISISIGYIHGG